MIAYSDWIPLAAVGGTFTTLALLKVYGFRKGIVGGGGRPVVCRLLGSCPSWSKQLNIIVTVFFLGIGVGCLGILLTLLLKP
jgi:hypothetical protein